MKGFVTLPVPSIPSHCCFCDFCSADMRCALKRKSVENLPGRPKWCPVRRACRFEDTDGGCRCCSCGFEVSEIGRVSAAHFESVAGFCPCCGAPIE